MKILFDIGGTKMRVAGSQNQDSFDAPVILETPKQYKDGMDTLMKTVLEISKGQNIESVSGGIAGPFSKRKSALVGSPNLKDWINKPFVEDLEKAFNCPVDVENDSAVVGLGEALYGAGKSFGIVAYMTISTGVGGARIVNGVLDERVIGFEPGHQIIDADKSMIPEADGIYLGNYISGKAIEKRTGKKPIEITDQSFWDTQAKLLAYGLNNTIVHWSPEVVILGGSMMNKVGIQIEKVEEYLKDILKVYPEVPVIRKSTLGDLGGLYGALALTKQR